VFVVVLIQSIGKQQTILYQLLLLDEIITVCMNMSVCIRHNGFCLISDGSDSTEYSSFVLCSHSQTHVHLLWGFIAVVKLIYVPVRFFMFIERSYSIFLDDNIDVDLPFTQMSHVYWEKWDTSNLHMLNDIQSDECE
jgi:hypothetical protein